MHEPKLLTIEEAAAAAAMNKRTFRRRLSAGEIPTIRSYADRRVKLIHLDDLKRFMGEEEPIRKAS